MWNKIEDASSRFKGQGACNADKLLRFLGNKRERRNDFIALIVRHMSRTDDVDERCV